MSNTPTKNSEKEPFYMTVLVKYESESDAPRVGANETVLGGKMVGVSFTDMFAEMEKLQSNTRALERGEGQGTGRECVRIQKIDEGHVTWNEWDGYVLAYEGHRTRPSWAAPEPWISGETKAYWIEAPTHPNHGEQP